MVKGKRTHIPELMLPRRRFPTITSRVHHHHQLLTHRAVKMSTSSIPTTKPPLNIYTTIPALRSFRQPLVRTKTLGFVPTMGALHAGHLSLIRTAARENDVVAVSIFVNPAQFSPTEDLDVYPRTLRTDLALLERLNDELCSSQSRGRVEALLVPSVAELYPHGIPQQEELQRGAFVTVQPLASRLEGATRPHFFRGVATVCAKLFNIVQPERAYFGQKDVQQSIVLKRLVRDLCFPVEIRVCPTGREEDGLAMSSRNVYLGEKRRKAAPVLYRALRAAEEEFKRLKAAGEAVMVVDAGKVRRKGLEVLRGMGEGEGEDVVKVEVEYFSLADTQELEELEEVDARKGAVLSAAVKMLPSQDGEIAVRLIDNIVLEGERNDLQH